MKFVTANGLKFGYLEQGTGPLVLLVHGFPDTPYTWDAAMPAIAAAGFRAVAPFTRGYHPTEIPADGDYDGDTLGKDILALIEALLEGDAAMTSRSCAINPAWSLGPIGGTPAANLPKPWFDTWRGCWSR